MTEGRWKRGLRRLLPRRIVPHRILAGPLRGMRIVTSWHDYPAAILGRTEHELLAWFDRNVRPGETWLDVGAHYGYTALALSRSVGARGRVFAFEPGAATFGHLARTRALNGLAQLRVLPLGLGTPDTLELRRLGSERGMLGSTIDLGNSVAAASAETPLIARLDWLWPRICEGDRTLHGVKIDVEGMELEVVAGMADLLKTYAPKVVVEVHHGVDRARLRELLIGAGYSGLPAPVERAASPDILLDGHSYYFPALA
jgi:FkbM family methyltransferase